VPKEFSRSDRVADFIKREVALLLQQEMRDPRVKNPNVNAVIVSRDMSMAKVYVTFFDVETKVDAKEAVDVLNGAAGFIRSKIASQHTMRSTPKLRFYFDESVRTGEHLSNLIDRAVASNSKDDLTER
jgi:ribosome-binding factor A